LEARYPDLAYHLQPRAGLGRESWVLLPPEYRRAASAWGQALAVGRAGDDEPVLLLHARGLEAARFDRIDADLKPLLAGSLPPAAALARERAWLAQGGHDERALWLVLGLELRHCAELGEAPSPGDWALLRDHPPATPGPWTDLGRYLSAGSPERALGAFDKALALDPLYAPAFVLKAGLLDRMGRVDDAKAQRARNAVAQAQGAWTVGE
jgi:tetratricopeptide (TPR) repeat protein